MKTALLLTLCAIALGLTLGGCATHEKEYGTCRIPAIRDAGMGVKLHDCIYRTFP